MKKIMITGCNGQLGRAINEIYKADIHFSLLNTDIEQLDITKIDDVMAYVRSEKPDVIVNCAAHTGVDACETEEDKAYKINAIGPRNLSIGATEIGAKIIQVSTDYVFEGKGKRPYIEFDKTGPKGMYGITKLEGENFVKEFSEKHFIIRTAWLYGDGKNFVKTMLGLAQNHDKVTVVGDQFGSPTSADELARAVAYLLPTDNFGLFHGTCEGMTNWADFTREIYRLAGKMTVVETVTTQEYDKNAKGVVAPRPAYSVLENYMFKLTTNYMFADWEKAIAEYLAQ